MCERWNDLEVSELQIHSLTFGLAKIVVVVVVNAVEGLC
jgi:translation elongation factor EF-1beta